MNGRFAFLAPACGAALFVVVWWIASALKLVDPVLLPSPQDSWRALLAGTADGTLTHDFLKTVWRTLLSFVIALAVAVPLGIVLGASERLYRSVEFVIDFFRSTPASAMFPLFLVLFGVGEATKVAV